MFNLKHRDNGADPQAESGTHSAGDRGSGPVGAADARRHHPRHHVELEVTMESETNFYLGLTENLSEGGLFIATHLHKPIGTQIEVSFKLPDVAEPIKVTGTVRWVREYSETTEAHPGMGIRFEHLGREEAEQIQRFLAARDPLFFDED